MNYWCCLSNGREMDSLSIEMQSTSCVFLARYIITDLEHDFNLKRNAQRKSSLFFCHPLDEIERFSESVFRLFLETGFSFTTIPAFLNDWMKDVLELPKKPVYFVTRQGSATAAATSCNYGKHSWRISPFDWLLTKVLISWSSTNSLRWKFKLLHIEWAMTNK